MPGGQTLAQAYVQILPTTKGIKGNLAKEMGGAGDSAGNVAGTRFSGAFKKLAIAGAAAAGAALTKSIMNGAALEQSLGGVETLYKNHADIVISNANNAWKTAGLSANAYMEQSTMFAASLLQSLGGDTEAAAKYADMAITDMSDNSNKFGTNIEDIQNAYQGFAKQNYTMLDNLKLGYGGTKGEMERLLSDAEKISGQKYDINNLNDVYEAIHVVQQELGIAGTTAKEAEGTLSGSFASMKAAADNFLGNLSMRPELVGESMQNLVTSVNTFLFSNLIPAIGNVIKALPTAIGTFINQGIPQLMESGKALLDGLMKGMSNNTDFMAKIMPMIANFTSQLPKMAGNLVNVGMGLLKKLAEGIAKGLPALVQYGPRIITNLANVINNNAPKILAGAANIMLTLGKGLIKAIPVFIKNIPQIFKAFLAVWEAINWLNLGKLAMTGIKNGMTAAIKTIGPKIKSAFNGVKNAMLAPIRTARDLIAGVVNAIKKKLGFSGIVDSVKATFKKAKDAITKPINDAKDKIKGVISKIKGYFPFSLGKILTLKVPKVTLSGGKAPWGIAGKGKLPSFHVGWNAKAMDNPYMFNKATLFGAGEAGDEVLYGRRNLMNDISEAVSGRGDIVINLNYDASDDATDMLRDIVRGVKRYRMAGAF